MANGLSLHIGLNSVVPIHYQGWPGTLVACEADAKDMGLIAQSQRFTPKILLTKQATRDAVTKQLMSIASKLKSGDIFFLSYSGHGGQVPDVDGDEPDGKEPGAFTMASSWMTRSSTISGSSPRACASSCFPTAVTAERC